MIVEMQEEVGFWSLMKINSPSRSSDATSLLHS